LEIFEKLYGEKSEFFTSKIFITLFYFIKLDGIVRDKSLFLRLIENLNKYEVEKNIDKEKIDIDNNKIKLNIIKFINNNMVNLLPYCEFDIIEFLDSKEKI
jgi:hypothetical protein